MTRQDARIGAPSGASTWESRKLSVMGSIPLVGVGGIPMNVRWTQYARFPPHCL